MRLRSSDGDVINVTSRWKTDQRALTIVNATRRDAGLVVCYHVTSRHRSLFQVFRVAVLDDITTQGLYLPSVQYIQYNIRLIKVDRTHLNNKTIRYDTIEEEFNVGSKAESDQFNLQGGPKT